MDEHLKNIRNIMGFLAVSTCCFGMLNMATFAALADESLGQSHSTSKAPSDSDSLMTVFAQQARNYEKLFKAGDAEALSDLWTADGMLETSSGQICRGKAELKDYFTRDFSKFGSQQLTVNITGVHSPAPDVAIEKGTTSIGGRSPSGRYTALHIKKDGEWKMSWVMESAINDRDISSVKALGWLAGKWKSTVVNGDAVEMQAKWIENGTFLECTTFDTQLKAEVRQIIGYSPLNGTLVSWHFAPNGGFGQGEWTRIPDGWKQETAGVSQEGIRTYATYTLKPRNKDTFTWQSTQRSINGVSVPDSTILVLNRVSE
jgi:ketosteroid isomerase-like protein